MVSSLLAEIVRKDNGCIVLNIFEAGSQHVDHVENQYIGAYAQQPTPNPSHCVPHSIAKPHSHGENLQVGERGGEVTLPEVLATDEAIVLWKKAQAAGWVDANYQPLISRTQAALLADAMAEKLGIRQKWKTFETLWKRKNMYRDYYKSLNLQQSLVFQDKIKKIFR